MYTVGRLVFCTALIAFAGSARAACALPGNHANPALLKTFASSPNAVLAMYPRGGVPLEGAVSALVGADSGNETKVIYLVLLANKQQRLAIAKGLRWVSDFCGAHDPELAQRIRRDILRSGSSELITQYDQSDNLGDDIAGSPTQDRPVLPSHASNAPPPAFPQVGDPAARQSDPNAAVMTDPFAPMNPIP